MARFNDAWMETLLSRNDIVPLVSEYVSLRAKGRKLWGLCPFHTEKTPSFSVSGDKQMYYCFGCGAGGGIVQFIMDMERLPYYEAIRFLAQRAGLEMPDEIDDEALQRERARKERLYAACKLAARFFHDTLLSEQGAIARKYLAQRGLNARIVQRFGMGYAPDSWNALLNQLKSEGYKEEDLVDAGLLVRNAKTGNVYDAYRNRVTFPIIGTNGRVLGFGARTMGEEIPKYINTGDTPIYSKRQNLYALNLLKGAKAEDAVIVEGYMDVISLHAAGVQNAVASLGTALTQQQARLLKRYVPAVYIAYDGDSAGQNATLRGLDILSQEGLHVKVVQMPPGLDPDDFIRHKGKEAFESLKDQALALNAFKLMKLAEGYDLGTQDGRQEYALAGCRFIAALQPVEQERYYAELARSTGLSVDALRAQGNRSGSAAQMFDTKRSARVGNRARREQAATDRERNELLLLHAMMQAQDAAQLVQLCGISLEELFPGELLQDIAKKVLALYAQGARPDIPLLLSTLEPAQSEVISGIINEEETGGDAMKFAQDCINRIRMLDVEQEIQELRMKGNGEEILLEDKLQMAKRLQQLDALRRELK